MQNNDENVRPSAENVAQELTGGRRSAIFGRSADRPRIVELPLTLIERNPNQPRKFFKDEALNELAASIERHGLLQPITVKKIDGQEGYLLVAGERRFRAFELLGRETVPAIITTGDPDELALIENLQRENLNPLEEAEALSRLREMHNYTQEELGKALGKTKSAISMTLKVLELPAEIREVETSQLDPLPKSILLEIARVKGAKKQKELYEAARQGQMMTARAARDARKGLDKRKQAAPDEERIKRSEVQHTIGLGRGFTKRLKTVSEEYLSDNQAQYAALYDIVYEAYEVLENVRRNIGDPTQIAPTEAAAEEHAA